jgi:hypothetical protein
VPVHKIGTPSSAASDATRAAGLCRSLQPIPPTPRVTPGSASAGGACKISRRPAQILGWGRHGGVIHESAQVPQGGRVSGTHRRAVGQELHVRPPRVADGAAPVAAPAPCRRAGPGGSPRMPPPRPRPQSTSSVWCPAWCPTLWHVLRSGCMAQALIRAKRWPRIPR